MHTLLYLFFSLCAFSGFSILISIIKHSNEPKIETSIFQHYLIKLSIVISLVISYSMCHSLIRCTLSLVSSSSVFSQTLSIATLLFFIVIIYPFSMFLLIDLSPENNRVCAQVLFPNCFTFFNIYQPLLAFVTTTGNINLIISVVAVGFLLMTVFLLKFPCLTWKYNKISQSIFGLIIWTILYRFLELIVQQ